MDEPRVQCETPAANRTKRKRSPGQEHEEILAQDERKQQLFKMSREARAKRDRAIILDECPEPKMPRVLGKILRHRFRVSRGQIPVLVPLSSYRDHALEC